MEDIAMDNLLCMPGFGLLCMHWPARMHARRHACIDQQASPIAGKRARSISCCVVLHRGIDSRTVLRSRLTHRVTHPRFSWCVVSHSDIDSHDRIDSWLHSSH